MQIVLNSIIFVLISSFLINKVTYVIMIYKDKKLLFAIIKIIASSFVRLHNIFKSIVMCFISFFEKKKELNIINLIHLKSA